MLPFRRRNNSIRPVHRIKHVVDQQGGLIAGTQGSNVLVNSVDAPLLASANQVETSSTVNGIYLHVEANATSSAALSNFYIFIAKNPGNNLTFPEGNVVGSDDNKKYVIHQEMVMFQQQDDSNPRTVFNGVIIIPKDYRRFAINDRLVIFLFSPGVNTNFCFQCHYKEFR